MTELERYRQRLVQSRRELAEAQKAALAAEERLDMAKRQAAGLEQIVAGLELLAEAEREPQKEQLPVEELAQVNGAADQPRGREAVRRVMREHPDRAWQQAAIVQAVMERGWIDPNAKQPDAAIRVAVRRLAEDGELERVLQGVYRYKGSGVTTPGEAIRVAGESETTTLNEEG